MASNHMVRVRVLLGALMRGRVLATHGCHKPEYVSSNLTPAISLSGNERNFDIILIGDENEKHTKHSH